MVMEGTDALQLTRPAEETSRCMTPCRASHFFRPNRPNRPDTHARTRTHAAHAARGTDDGTEYVHAIVRIACRIILYYQTGEFKGPVVVRVFKHTNSKTLHRPHRHVRSPSARGRRPQKGTFRCSIPATDEVGDGEGARSRQGFRIHTFTASSALHGHERPVPRTIGVVYTICIDTGARRACWMSEFVVVDPASVPAKFEIPLGLKFHPRLRSMADRLDGYRISSTCDLIVGRRGDQGPHRGRQF